MTDIATIKDNVDGACRQAMFIPLEDAVALVNEFERTNALMPLFDPTGYIKISSTIGGHEQMAKAFLEFRAELEKIVNDG